MLSYYNYYPSYTWIVFVFSILINIIVAVLIYNDAKKRGMEAALWAIIICLLGWCCGGIIYLIVMQDHPPGNQTESGPRPSDSHLYGQSQESQSKPAYEYREPEESQPPKAYQQPEQTYKPVSSETTKKKMKFCQMCGAEIPAGDQYCSHCGARQD